jgi:hypothetical protein
VSADQRRAQSDSNEPRSRAAWSEVRRGDERAHTWGEDPTTQQQQRREDEPPRPWGYGEGQPPQQRPWSFEDGGDGAEVVVADEQRRQRWQDEISTGFDRLVALASEVDRRKSGDGGGDGHLGYER